MKSARLFRGIFVASGVVMLVALVRMTAHSTEEEPKFEQIFSPLYQRFDAASMATPGSTSTHVKKVGSWNTASLRGSRELHGVFEFKPEAATTADVFRAVHRSVDAVTTKNHVEGADPRLPADGNLPVLNDGKSPTYAMWMYNWENRHGELHVWLFPNPDGTKIGFAAHLIEETLQ